MHELAADGIRLVSASPELLGAEDISGDRLAGLLGVLAPPSWPPMFNDAETRIWVRNALHDDPDAEGWNSWYIVADAGEGLMLAGIFGYKGAPDLHEQVEVGYSVVPDFSAAGWLVHGRPAMRDRVVERGQDCRRRHTTRTPAVAAGPC